MDPLVVLLLLYALGAVCFLRWFFAADSTRTLLYGRPLRRALAVVVTGLASLGWPLYVLLALWTWARR